MMESSTYNMTGMDEMCNETYLESYINSTISRYHELFTHPEDSPIMSFSELFSSQEGIGIKQTSVKVDKSVVKNVPEDANDTVQENLIRNNNSNDRQSKPFCKTVDLGIDKPLAKIENPIVKSELENRNDTYEQNIVGMEVVKIKVEDNGNNVVDSFKKEDTVINNVISLNKDNPDTSTTKNKINLETEKNKMLLKEYLADRRNLKLLTSESKNLTTTSLSVIDTDKSTDIIEQFDHNTEEHIISGEKKIEEKEERNTTKEISIKEDKLQEKQIKIDCMTKLLPSSFVSEIVKKSSVMNGSLVEIEKECSSNDSFMSNNKTQGKYTDTFENFSFLKKYETFQTSANSFDNELFVMLKKPIVKYESEDRNDTYEQNIVKMEVAKIKVEDNGIDVVDSFKKKDIFISNVISLNKDNSDISTTKNEINLENGKNKISWKENRAKLEKLRLYTSKNKSEAKTELSALDNQKCADVTKKNICNTAEGFIGRKRNIEEEEKKITTKEIIKEEDELHIKRMKIEHIMKLHPSSIASEIAKTSSLIKGSSEKTKNENTSSNTIMTNVRTHGKYTDTYEDLGYLNKHDWSQKKDQQTRAHSSHYSSRSHSFKKSCQSSSDYYRKRGHCGENAQNIIERPENKVVYIGQISMTMIEEYLYQRFEKYGKIQGFKFHNKPDLWDAYALITYTEVWEAECAVSNGNNDRTQVKLDIQFEKHTNLKMHTQDHFYNLDNEWFGDHSHHVSTQQSDERSSFEKDLQEFSYRIQIDKKIKQKEYHQTRTHSSPYSSRPDDVKKSSQSSISPDYYHKSEHHGENAQNIIERPEDKVVYIGQIPISVMKDYLHQHFEKFGEIESLTFHKKLFSFQYYAFVTYSKFWEAECAVNHGNNNISHLLLDIQFAYQQT